MSPTICIEGHCYFGCGGDFVVKANHLYVPDEQKATEANQWLESYPDKTAFCIETDSCGQVYVVGENGTLEPVDSTAQKSGKPLEIRSL